MRKVTVTRSFFTSIVGLKTNIKKKRILAYFIIYHRFYIDTEIYWDIKLNDYIPNYQVFLIGFL